MGIAIAEEFAARGASVELITGPSSLNAGSGIKTVKVTSAGEMYDACMQAFHGKDITVMAAAVADYTPEEYSDIKIKKNDDNLVVHLKKTKDILKQLGEIKTGEQVLVGFALETNNEKENALAKLMKKNLDLIVLNSLNDEGAGFGKETNKIVIFDKQGKHFSFETKSKKMVAKDIVNTIIRYEND
jgi:phosphopantothenoylcysteine decarboxylase/phosphopantothenate--cysteine ligase